MNNNAVASIATKSTELTNLQAKMESLRNSINAERTAVLVGLPASLGYTNASDFMIAFNEAHRTSGSARKTVTRGASGKGKSARKPAKAKGRKDRVSITPDRRKEIIAFFKADGKALDAVQKFDISLATAQNIKKEAGMVTPRG
jgi:hypothetical protein